MTKKAFLAHVPASCPVCGCPMEDAGTTSIPIPARRAVCPNCGYIASFAERSEDVVQVEDDKQQPSQCSDKEAVDPEKNRPKIADPSKGSSRLFFSRFKFRFLDIVRKKFFDLRV